MNKTTKVITESEYKKLKSLVKKAHFLNEKLEGVYRDFKKIARDDDGGYSTDVVYNKMSMNWLLHGLNIKVKK